jgi:hypothetical protein
MAMDIGITIQLAIQHLEAALEFASPSNLKRDLTQAVEKLESARRLVGRIEKVVPLGKIDRLPITKHMDYAIHAFESTSEVRIEINHENLKKVIPLLKAHIR